MLQTRNKNISSDKKKKITVPRNSEEDISFDFLVTNLLFFALFQWLSITRRYLLIGSQSFVNIAVLLFTETLKVGDVICCGYLIYIVFH